MATRTDTSQFTARIDKRMLNAIRMLAERKGISVNEQLNDIVEAGLIAHVAKLKKQKAGTTIPA